MKNSKGVLAVLCSLVLLCLVVINGVTQTASAAAKLSKTGMTLTVGESSNIKINNKVKSATYAFKSSNTKIATVNKKGLVKGIQAGTATITVTSTIKKKVTKVGTIKVTVKEAEPSATPTPTLTPTPTPTTAPVEVPKDATGAIDYSKAKLIALTFDDGPNTGTTPKVLDKLEKYNVVASFFLIGSNISDSTKPIMERQLKDGCEINNHSWSHQDMSKFTEEKSREEIEKTSAKIKDMVGVTPKFFRPPYILTSPTMYKAIDLPFINGINGTDWDASKTAKQRADAILAQAQDGNIILMHDFNGNDNTVAALDLIIPELQKRGFVFVTVSKLFEYKGVEPNKENTIWSLVKK